MILRSDVDSKAVANLFVQGSEHRLGSFRAMYQTDTFILCTYKPLMYAYLHSTIILHVYQNFDH